MHARFFSRIQKTKKLLFRISRTTILSLVLILSIASPTLPLFAQTAPTITTFSANPSVVPPNGEVALSWSTTDTRSCTASDGWSGSKATQGWERLTAPSTTTYTLTCTGAGSTVVTKSVTVTVSPDVAQDATFKNYKYLFNTAGHGQLKVGLNTSTFSFKSPIIDERTKTVPGLWFKFHFEFARGTTGKGAEYTWDHIAAPRKDSLTGFIVRVCDTGTTNNCVYSGVPYAEGLEDVAGTNNFFTSIFTGVSGTVKNLIDAYKNTTVIYRKSSSGASFLNPLAGSGDYLNAGSFDLFLTDFSALGTNFHTWFTIDNPDSMNGRTRPIAVDWVKKTTEKPQTASLWYCASWVSNNGSFGNPVGPVPITPYDAADNARDADIQRFGGLCRDNVGGSTVLTLPSSYFKIAEVSLDPITSYEAAAAVQEKQTFENPDDKVLEKSILPACGVQIAGIGKGTVLGCVARVIYHLIYRPIAWIAGIFGNLFDFFLGYSVSDEAYRQEFLVNGWRIVRDISNIFFIIILIWTGLAAVFGISSVSMKQVVPALIVNAIIINFSLFATRTIIDVSNIFARVFYNNINVHIIDPNTNMGTIEGTRTVGGYKAISEKIVGSFNPQQLFQTKFLSPTNALNAQTTIGSPNNVVGGAVNAETDNTDEAMSANEYAGYFIVITVIASLIMFGVAMMFWKTSFLFLGRVIGLYIAVIFSPFAFLTRKNMPIVGAIPQISWTTWLKDLSGYALMAPIFVFFLYVVWAFIKYLPEFTKTTAAGDGSFFQTVIAIAIPLLIVYFLLIQGAKLAKKYSGMVGDNVEKWAMKGTGLAGGVVLGAGGVVGARVIGGAAHSLEHSRFGTWLGDKSANSSFALWAKERLQKAQTGSFDARQTTIGKDLFKQMGLTETDNKYLDALKMAGVGPGLTTASRKGGLEAEIKEQQEKKEKVSKLLEERRDIDEVNKQLKQEQDKKAEKVIENRIVNALTAATTGFWNKRKAQIEARKKIKEWKQNDKAKYEEEKKKAETDPAVKNKITEIRSEKPLRSADEMTAERRKKYAEGLKEGTVFKQMVDGFAKHGVFGNTLVAKTIGAAISGTVGAAIGDQIENIGNKKAAKKIIEKNKISEDLVKIQKTLANGFNELIALEDFRKSPAFIGLNPDDQKAVMRGDKSLFDLLTPDEKQAVENKRNGLSDDDRKTYMERVKVQQENKYEMKKLKQELTTYKKALQDDPLDEKALKNYLQQLREIEKAKKHEKTWRDVNKYMEDQKKKLKDE